MIITIIIICSRPDFLRESMLVKYFVIGGKLEASRLKVVEWPPGVTSAAKESLTWEIRGDSCCLCCTAAEASVGELTQRPELWPLTFSVRQLRAVRRLVTWTCCDSHAGSAAERPAPSIEAPPETEVRDRHSHLTGPHCWGTSSIGEGWGALGEEPLAVLWVWGEWGESSQR